MGQNDKLLGTASEALRKLTDERLEVADIYTKKLAAYCTGIIMSGSTAYGPYHAVSPTSDVDLLVIVPSIDQEFPPIQDRTPHDIADFKEKGIESYSPRKINSINGIKTSLRIITEEAFKKICSGEPTMLNVYKPIVKKESSLYQGFDGREIEDHRETIAPFDFKGAITPSRNAIVMNGEYYMGSYLDRILGCGKILHDKEGWTAGQVEDCWKNVSAKLVKESKERLGKVDLQQLSIAKALCRYGRMPQSSRDFIDSQTKKWVSVAMEREEPEIEI